MLLCHCQRNCKVYVQGVVVDLHDSIGTATLMLRNKVRLMLASPDHFLAECE
jgi:hypothetical protein